MFGDQTFFSFFFYLPKLSSPVENVSPNFRATPKTSPMLSGTLPDHWIVVFQTVSLPIAEK